MWSTPWAGLGRGPSPSPPAPRPGRRDRGAGDRPRRGAAYTTRAGAPPPADLIFEAARLFRPEALVEVEVVAAVPAR
ncbi:hypothetical protein [Streptomyces luteogriseus]|uniref:hypothetical protein n=1 Tax=Streptomyces luteogriseus TaxID=68233 RepID=UPI0036937352